MVRRPASARARRRSPTPPQPARPPRISLLTRIFCRRERAPSRHKKKIPEEFSFWVPRASFTIHSLCSLFYLQVNPSPHQSSILYLRPQPLLPPDYISLPQLFSSFSLPLLYVFRVLSAYAACVWIDLVDHMRHRRGLVRSHSRNPGHNRMRYNVFSADNVDHHEIPSSRPRGRTHARCPLVHGTAATIGDPGVASTQPTGILYHVSDHISPTAYDSTFSYLSVGRALR